MYRFILATMPVSLHLGSDVGCCNIYIFVGWFPPLVALLERYGCTAMYIHKSISRITLYIHTQERLDYAAFRATGLCLLVSTSVFHD